jgi:glucose-1-phosphate thymidylyltransferase
MRGLVLAGGKGMRLRPLTFTRAKQLIPIANKPNLFYAIDDLVAARVTDIGIIISPETGAEVREALGDGTGWGATFTFIVQDAPRGLAHAVQTARDFLGEAPFIMYLGDNLLSGGIAHLVEEYAQNPTQSMVLLTPVDDPRQFGVAVLDADGALLRLIEKPTDPPSNLALVGIYLFEPAVHGVIEHLQPSGRGEYEITDAIQGLLDGGRRVFARRVRGWWKDTGKPEDLLDANRLVLSELRREVQGEVETTEIVGPVVVESGARLVGSTIRGPAHIGAGAVIEASYIGPYTSIGRGARVVRSEVEFSILLDDTTVCDLPYRLDSSILGQDAEAHGAPAACRKHTLRLVLSDRSTVQI